MSVTVGTAGAYAPLYNLLGYPCGTLPFTRVRADEETFRTPSRDRLEDGAYETDLGSAGLPVGVQIVGRPWREDTVLAAMEAIEIVARTRDDFPLTPISP
jgi:fatty acid amide hydrolase